jgi:hemerythrin
MNRSGWDHSLDTGNELIDGQHRELMWMIGQLAEAESRNEVLRALGRVVDFTLFHFQTEEDLMVQVGYPADLTKRMVEQHQILKSAALQHVLAFRRAETTTVLPAQAFLENLLKSHELIADRALADWIRENRGVAPVHAALDCLPATAGKS